MLYQYLSLLPGSAIMMELACIADLWGTSWELIWLVHEGAELEFGYEVFSPCTEASW